MKVLILHQYFVDHQHPGGTRHYELARHFIRKGHEVTVITGSVNYLTGLKYHTDAGLTSETNLDGIRVIRAYVPAVVHKSFAWRIFAFFCFMATSVYAGLRSGKTDVVVGTTPPIFQLPSAWLIAKIKRRPLVTEVRDLWPDFAIDMGILKNPTIIRLAHGVERFLYRRADHLIVNSPAYVDHVEAKGIDRSKISFVPNGVDIQSFDMAPKSDSSLRGEFKLPESTFVVSYTGAMGQANDIDTILRAADTLQSATPSVVFLLVGDGKEKKRLEEAVATRQLGNVRFAGTRPKTEIPFVLRESNACIATLQDIPMFRTTFPNKVFDYMAAARPTILCIEGVIKNVVESANGGICVRPGDDQGIVAAVTRLVENPAMSKTMGESARDYVVREFNRSNQADHFCDILQQLTCPQTGLAG